MKGYIDDKGNDRSPCGTCKHRNKMTVQEPCYSCIDNVDLALHKPNHETEFVHYKADHQTEKGGEGVRDRLTELPKEVSMFDILYADDGRIKR